METEDELKRWTIGFVSKCAKASCLTQDEQERMEFRASASRLSCKRNGEHPTENARQRFQVLVESADGGTRRRSVEQHADRLEDRQIKSSHCI